MTEPVHYEPMDETEAAYEARMERESARHAQPQDWAWIKSPSVRLWLYGVSAAVLALLGVLGLVTPEVSDAIEKVVAAVLIAGAAAPAMAAANLKRQ